MLLHVFNPRTGSFVVRHYAHARMYIDDVWRRALAVVPASGRVECLRIRWLFVLPLLGAI